MMEDEGGQDWRGGAIRLPASMGEAEHYREQFKSTE